MNQNEDYSSEEDHEQNVTLNKLKLMTQDVFNEFAQALDLENEYGIQN